MHSINNPPAGEVSNYQNGSILSNLFSASRKSTRTFPATRSRSSYLTGLIWATIRKTTPRRNSTNLTASQSDGSPTISKRQKPQKNIRELVTLVRSQNLHPIPQAAKPDF